MGSNRSVKAAAAAALFLISCVSCGIEDYAFLYPVPSGNVSVELNHRATIRLPDIDLTDYYYFTHFAVYYRIYISGSSYPTIHTGNMNDLNPLLYADYNAILPYTNGDTTASTATGSLLTNRNYYTLNVEGAVIENAVLAADARGKTVTLDFMVANPQPVPSLTVDGRQYNLQRSTGSGLFRPAPANRYFFNTSELNAAANVSNTINADVADRAGLDSGGDRYTYAAMYIVVTGIDDNLSPIYSAPTFIGVFLLPSSQ